MRVLKFGGTSLDGVDNMQRVGALLQELYDKKERFCVVVSAKGQITDRLIALAQAAAQKKKHVSWALQSLQQEHIALYEALCGHTAPLHGTQLIEHHIKTLVLVTKSIAVLGHVPLHTLDELLGLGELLSATLVTFYLKWRGLPCYLFDPRPHISTDNKFGAARVAFEKSCRRLREALGARTDKTQQIPIVPGFIGSTEKGQTTTLGRGGSDLTATLLGAALGAHEVQLWTDVHGVLSADPARVSDTRPIRYLSYNEAREMAYFGAKVLYSPCLLPVQKRGIPLRVKNTLCPSHEGTVIGPTCPTTRAIKGISYVDTVMLLTCVCREDVDMGSIGLRLSEVLDALRVSVLFAIHAASEYTVAFTIHPACTLHAVQTRVSQALSTEHQAQRIHRLETEKNLSLLALVGEDIGQQAGIAARVFQTLADKHINIVATVHGSSKHSLSLLVEKDRRSEALQSLHETFFSSEAVRVLQV